MKETRTFKAGTEAESLIAWLEGALVELTGDSAPTLGAKVRITVELVKADDLVIDPMLSELSLETAKAHVEKFLAYRRDEKRKSIKSVRALRNLLLQFKARPGCLRESVDQSISQGWLGLFLREGSGGSVSREYTSTTKGGPSGGTW